jgi:hypothetical protein
MGTRSDAIVGEATTLQFQFLKDGLNFEPFKALRVEIYPTYNDALNGTNIIETIAEANISTNGDGLLTYVASDVGEGNDGAYFDKVFIEPTNGAQEWSHINNYTVRKAPWGGVGPESIETARIYLNLFDITSDPSKTNIKVKLNKSVIYYNNELIRAEQQTYEPDEDGIVYMELIETTTLGDDVYYIFDIGDGLLKEKKKIPKGTLDANYKDLPNA